MKCSKTSPYFLTAIRIAALILINSSSAFAATETYSDSINNAVSNAGGSGAVDSAWLASSSSIISINGSDAHGLQYDSGGNLVVRTAAGYGGWMNSLYVNTPNYIYRSDKQPTDDAAAWVTTGNDMTKFVQNNDATVQSIGVIKTIERGLGMNDAGTHNAIIEYTVIPTNNYIMRPTKNPDAATYNPTEYGNDDVLYPFIKPTDMSDAVYANLCGFYENHRTGAYGPPATFPWTQLGYTYFWGNGETPPAGLAQIQGMTEFVILPQTPVNVYGIYSTQSYIYSLNKNGSLSTDNDAQYGNGFASFHMTGDCDSIWAGHRFQAGTRIDPANPNTITIDNGATLSGGQGLLVWSLNYDVVNHGTISGATATKIATSDTADVAVLFQGDTTAYGGIGAPGGIDALTNAADGVITSPGTAVQVAAGATNISNAGTINGTTYGVRILGGTNSIANTGTLTSAGTAIRLDGGTTTISNSGTINGGMVLVGGTGAIADIGSGAVWLSSAGAYVQGAGTKLKLAANSADAYGSISAASAAIDAASAIEVAINGAVANNAAMKVVDVSGAGIGSVPGTITSTSPVVVFNGSEASGDLVLTATRTNVYSASVSTANSAAVGSTLNAIAAAGSAAGDMLAVLNLIDSSTSQAQVASAIDAVTPPTNNSVNQTSYAMLTQFIGTVINHLGNMQNAAGMTGFSTGDVVKGSGVWAQGFDTYIHQDPRGASNGYNANIWGASVGYDVPLFECCVFGLSGGYAYDNIRTKDNGGRTGADSWQGSVYASYGRDAYYLNGVISFAYNLYETSRHVAFASVDRIPKGDYAGQQYSGYLEGGYVFKNKKLSLTPFMSMQYAHLRLGGYTERDAGSLNLATDAENYDLFQTGIGMKLAYSVAWRKRMLTPELHAKWLYDWIGDNQQATSTFTGGGGSFTTNGFTPAQSSYDFGAKITLEPMCGITLSLNYDFEVKEDFFSHSGLVNVRYDF